MQQAMNKPTVYRFQLHNARPMELMAMAGANLQWWAVQEQKRTGSDALFREDTDAMKGLANEAAWRSYRDALIERKQMLNFWTPAARAAAKGNGPLPPVRLMLWNGRITGPFPPNWVKSVTVDDVIEAASAVNELVPKFKRLSKGHQLASGKWSEE